MGGEPYSQLARAGVHMWDRVHSLAGPRAPDKGGPALPHVDPMAHWVLSGALGHPPNLAFPKLEAAHWQQGGGRGDTRPGCEPPSTCSESEKRNSIIYTHSSGHGHGHGSWFARSTGQEPR